jgi:hypothetical protein
MNVPELYQHHYIDKQFERAALFEKIQKNFGIKKALYPGSFVHVTPSFYIPHVVYVDSDKNAKKFFTHLEEITHFIESRKIYPEAPIFQFIGQDYSKPLDLEENSFDLIVSQWAGPISQSCKHYLKLGGFLLANNSHADAGMAFLDPDYALVAVVNAKKEKYTFSNENLDAYFIPKKGKSVTLAQLLESGKGVGYTKTANCYLFKKIK